MTTEIQTDASEKNEMIDNVETVEQIEAIDIGNSLKTKRQELGFDERYVATELKIPIDQVRALESNQFDYFRSVTFARGFLKSYCKLLDLDTKELLAAFDGERAEAEPSTIKPVDKVNKQTNLSDPIVVFISVVIVAVLIFLVFWWPSKADEQIVASSNQTAAQESSSTSQVDTDQNVSDNGVPEQNSDKEAETSVPDVATGLSAETVAILKDAGVKPEDVVKATSVDPIADPVKEVPSYKNEVEITFDADCWAEIRDGSGKILFSGVKSAGSQLALNGEAPYRVVLGYARGVSSLKYKGEEFDFSSYTRKDLARFELK